MMYGDPWVKTLAKAIEMYPRYKIAALDAWNRMPRAAQ